MLCPNQPLAFRVDTATVMRPSDANIQSLCKQRRLKEAVDLLYSMDQAVVALHPSSVAEVLLLCTSTKDLIKGKQVHSIIKKSGIKTSNSLDNKLLSMYTKCGSLQQARRVFDEMMLQDVVSWNAMIAGYAKYGYGNDALELFWKMQQCGINPNKTTFVCILKACAPPLDIEEGRNLYTQIVNYGFEQDMVVSSAIVAMYNKFGKVHDSRLVFEQMTAKDVVSWTLMISGYVESGHGEEALSLFEEMLQKGLQPDIVVFLSILSACASLKDLEQGKRIHKHIVNKELERDPFLGSALVDMYAKCGTLELASQVFKKLHSQDVVSWTALISGYEQQGLSEEALLLFNEMKRAGIEPNEFTFVSLINACSSLSALSLGLSIHSDIVNSGFDSCPFVVSALVDMYAKCGKVEHASIVFMKLSFNDTVIWNTMIDGLAQHGSPKAALELFRQMKQKNVPIDSTTFVGVLSACNHAGLVDEGLSYFHSMFQYGIKPSAEHCGCMVDIFGRAGLLEEAKKLLCDMPFAPSSSVWTALLNACIAQSNIEVARFAVNSMLKLEPNSEGAYILLSNIYAMMKGHSSCDR